MHRGYPHRLPQQVSALRAFMVGAAGRAVQGVPFMRLPAARFAVLGIRRREAMRLIYVILLEIWLFLKIFYQK